MARRGTLVMEAPLRSQVSSIRSAPALTRQATCTSATRTTTAFASCRAAAALQRHRLRPALAHPHHPARPRRHRRALTLRRHRTRHRRRQHRNHRVSERSRLSPATASKGTAAMAARRRRRSFTSPWVSRPSALVVLRPQGASSLRTSPTISFAWCQQQVRG